MNIKRAKQEIKDAVQAYLMKDEYGEYQIPAIHQRPILLMGPPGIGKTQIMEQISRECETECDRASVYSDKDLRWKIVVVNRVYDE